MHLLETAITRDVEPSPTTPVVWGVDVARYGSDRSALAKRRGQELLEPIKTYSGKDIMEMAGIILSEYEAVRYSDRPEAIYIDAIGIGAGLADRLKELDLPAVSVAVSESASLKDKFGRLRDELFSKLLGLKQELTDNDPEYINLILSDEWQNCTSGINELEPSLRREYISLMCVFIFFTRAIRCQGN